MALSRKIAALGAAALWLIAGMASAAGLTLGAGTELDLGSTTLNLACQDLTVAGTFRASSGGLVGARDVAIDPGGTLDGGAATLELAGDWSNAGTFTAGSSNVTLVDGCGRTSATISGTNTFTTLTLVTSTAKTWRFAAGATQTVTTALTLSGGAGNLLLLRSTAGGSEAFLDLQGSQSVSYVDVADNHATGTAIALGPESTIAGNTSGWTFQWTASGRFRYTDRLYDLSGFTGTAPAPVREADVEVYDLNSSAVLGSGATDANGDFSVLIQDDAIRDVGVRVLSSADETPSLNHSVVDDLSASAVYAYHDAASDVLSHASGDVPFGTLDMPASIGVVGSTDWSSQVFNMFDMGVLIADWIAHVDGARPSIPYSLGWNPTNGRTSSFYSPDANRVSVSDDDGYDDPNVLHEIGHYVEDEFGQSDSPGGTHFITDNDQDPRLAWSEGLATFLSNAALELALRPRPDIYCDRDSFGAGGGGGFAYELESGTPFAASGGGTSEVAVNQALWDVIDDAATLDGTPLVDDDPLDIAHADPWSVLEELRTQNLVNVRMADFWDLWLALALGQQSSVQSTLGGSQIDFLADALEPNDTPTDATVLTVGGPYLENTFYDAGSNAAGDEDWFRFPAVAGTTYRIEMNGTNGAVFGRPDPELFLLDPDLEILAYNDDPRDLVLNTQSSSTAQDMAESVPGVLWRAPATGDHYLYVRHASYARNLGGRYGTYQLRVRSVAAPAPSISEVAAQRMLQGQAYPLLILGNDFAVGATVSAPGLTTNRVEWISPDAIVAEMAVDPGTPDGPVDLTVTNPGGAQGTLVAAAVVSSAAQPPVMISEIELGADRVEVRNLGTSSATLTGWQLRSYRASFATQTFSFPAFSLAAGATVVVHEYAGTDTATELYDPAGLFNWPWVNGAGGGVSLVDDAGRNVDYIRFVAAPVDEHEAPLGSGGGWMQPELQSAPGGHSLARSETDPWPRTRRGLAPALRTMPIGAAGRDNAVDAFEDNDTPRRGRLFPRAGTLGGLAISGRPSGFDEDWFGFPVAAGTPVTFTAAFTHAAGNLDLELFAPGDESVPFLSAASSTDDEVLALTSALSTTHGSGVYRLRVRGVAGAVNGYDLIASECGDGVTGIPEECDDGGLVNGDGCSSLCLLEDSDGDGVDNDLEEAAPNGGDANDDGTPDRDQSSVASLPGHGQAGYVTLVVSGGCASATNVTVLAEVGATMLDPDYAYPVGLLGFRVPCAAATLDLLYHGAAAIPLTYRKLGPTAPGVPVTEAWYTFPGVAFGTTLVGGASVPTATLNLVDGAFGDDTAVDGEIVGLGGPGVSTVPAVGIGAMLSAMILMTAAAWRLRRRTRGVR